MNNINRFIDDSFKLWQARQSKSSINADIHKFKEELEELRHAHCNIEGDPIEETADVIMMLLALLFWHIKPATKEDLTGVLICLSEWIDSKIERQLSPERWGV